MISFSVASHRRTENKGIIILLLIKISLTYKSHSKSYNKYQQDEILDMLIANIFYQFGRLVFEQSTAIPIGKYSALQLGDLFLHAYDVIPVNGKD
jgi:hypothetical protein